MMAKSAEKLVTDNSICERLQTESQFEIGKYRFWPIGARRAGAGGERVLSARSCRSSTAASWRRATAFSAFELALP